MQSETVYRFDIPAGTLDAALSRFGQQSGLLVSVNAELTTGLTTPGLQGDFSALDALRTLLAGTGLTFRFADDNAVMLMREVSQKSDSALKLDAITVTARRTEERLQRVPGSVFALVSEELEASNITDLAGLALRTPNLSLTESGARDANRIAIRGISNVNTNRASAPTVGVYVDEVMLNPTGSPIGISPNLYDLERVEVAYGPQGTAFGRGTIGGAVNYVTKKPTEDFEVELEGELGSHPDGLARVMLNGPLTGDRNLMARLVAFGRDDQGFIDAPNIGGSNDSQDYGARLSLRSQPTERFTLDFAGSFDRSEYRQPDLATSDSIDNEDLELLVDRDGDSRIDRSLVTLGVKQEFDAGSVNFTAAYSRTETNTFFEDGTELDFLFGTFENENDSTSQEIRFIASPFEIPFLGQVDYLIGANANQAEELTHTVSTLGADNTIFGSPGDTVFFESKEEVSDIGVFGEFRFRPVEQLELAVGGRYSYTDVEISQPGFDPTDESFEAFTPKGSIRYDWTDRLSTYALISTGFKSGGFNAFASGPLSARTFDNETATNYELGIKSSWLENRLFVNASLFALYYDDMQVIALLPTVVPPASIVQNAGSARSIGGELEVAALPAEGLQLNLAYGYTDAEFTDYEDAPGGDASGQRLPSAPRHTLSLVGDYSFPIMDSTADAFIRAEYSYNSNFTLVAAANAEVFDAYDVFNLRLGLRGEGFDVEVFVENAFDEHYVTGSTGPGSFLSSVFGVSEPFEVGPTRRFGLRARYRF